MYVEKLITFFLPKDHDPTSETHQQTRLLLIYSGFISILLLAYTLIYAFFLMVPIVAWACLISFVLSLALPLLYKYTGFFLTTARLIILNGLWVVIVTATQIGGSMAYSMFWLALTPLVGGFLEGRRSAMGWGVVALVIILGFYLFEMIWGQFPNVVSSDRIKYIHLFVLLGMTFLSMVFTYLFQRVITLNVLQLKEKREESNQMLQIISHDIRNPLSIILIKCQIALETNQMQKIEIEKIQRAAQVISNIVEHTRKLRALETGKTTLELGPVSVKEMIENARFIFADSLKTKNISLEVTIDGNEEIVVLAEPISLSNQVINNVISNAIKFSHKNKTIFVHVFGEDDVVHITIKDQGIGIPKAFMKSIFSPTKETFRKGTQGELGTGFGLPITRSFMTSFGGSITVHSQTIEENPVDHGTTISLTFKRVHKLRRVSNS